MKKGLFWSNPLLFVIEGYLDICLGIVMYYHSHAGYKKSGDVIDFVMVSIFSFFVVAVPFGSVWFLASNRYQIREMEEDS